MPVLCRPRRPQSLLANSRQKLADIFQNRTEARTRSMTNGGLCEMVFSLAKQCLDERDDPDNPTVMLIEADIITGKGDPNPRTSTLGEVPDGVVGSSTTPLCLPTYHAACAKLPPPPQRKDDTPASLPNMSDGEVAMLKSRLSDLVTQLEDSRHQNVIIKRELDEAKRAVPSSPTGGAGAAGVVPPPTEYEVGALDFKFMDFLYPVDTPKRRPSLVISGRLSG